MAVVLNNNFEEFSFENCRRNAHLKTLGIEAPKIKKTGTTLAAAVCKGGVVLGSDTRATSGSIISDKDCMKLHYISDNMYLAGAGGAADLNQTARMISSKIELHRLNTGRPVPVVAAARMLKQLLFRYQGNIAAWFLLGGVDSTGSYLFRISAYGHSAPALYEADGSGSFAALSYLEPNWKPGMEVEDCKKLVGEAVRHGGVHDNMSGNHVNLAVITKEKSEVFHHYIVIDKKGDRVGSYDFPFGTTPVLQSKVMPIIIEDVFVKKNEDVAMASP